MVPRGRAAQHETREDKLTKAPSSYLPIKMIAEWTQSNALQNTTKHR